MIASAADLLLRLIRPERIWGPIFSKELRVSSRRRRNYVLRFVYLAILTIFVALVWAATTTSSRMSSAYTISRMAMAGKTVIGAVVWFQFCAIQLIAVVMLSNSISDEIYHKTLGLLMTTPINSFQIIVGKLLSKLWQLIVLVGISVPLLAIVRVFGGVPWDFVISGVCITVTAAIFAGSVSMYFSIRTRRAYAVILKTLLTGAVLYLFLPMLIIYVIAQTDPDTENFLQIFLYGNPVAALWFKTMTMASPRILRGLGFTFYWPVHCGVMLAASGLVLSSAIKKVRKVALRQATGEAGTFVSRKQLKAQKRTHAKAAPASPAAVPAPPPEARPGTIRRVKGSPLIWKELRAQAPRASRRTTLIAVAFAVGAVLLSYVVCAAEDCLDENFTHIIYTEIFVILGLIDTAVLSATAITSEKESRSWPILLATPLSDWQIVFGKACGVARRVLPIWLFLGAHLAIFTLARQIHPIAVVHLGMLVAWVVVFFTGSGLYFSAAFRRTTTAVVMNFALALALWLALPGVVALSMEATRSYDDDFLEFTGAVNPIVQAGVIMEGAGGSRNARRPYSRLDYDGPEPFDDSVEKITGAMLAFMLVYGAGGWLFAWRAEKRIRRNIF